MNILRQVIKTQYMDKLNNRCENPSVYDQTQLYIVASKFEKDLNKVANTVADKHLFEYMTVVNNATESKDLDVISQKIMGDFITESQKLTLEYLNKY